MAEHEDGICPECGHDENEPDAPTPDDVALAAMAALLSSGKFDGSPEAAVGLAWKVCVPAYYKERNGFSAFMESLHGG